MDTETKKTEEILECEIQGLKNVIEKMKNTISFLKKRLKDKQSQIINLSKYLPNPNLVNTFEPIVAQIQGDMLRPTVYFYEKYIPPAKSSVNDTEKTCEDQTTSDKLTNA